MAIWNGDALNCTENRRTAVEAFLYPNVPTKDYAAETPLAFLYGNHEYGGQYARHIDEVMMARPVFVHDDAYAAELLKIFEKKRIDDLPVCDRSGRVVGLVDIQDLPKMKVL